MTSRNRHVRQFAPALALDVFGERTAVAYLIERAERSHDRAGAERLARALGYVPLALVHAAAYCANSGESFDEYCELLDALPAQKMFDRNPEASYEQTVASTWRGSSAGLPAVAFEGLRPPHSRAGVAATRTQAVRLRSVVKGT